MSDWVVVKKIDTVMALAGRVATPMATYGHTAIQRVTAHSAEAKSGSLDPEQPSVDY